MKGYKVTLPDGSSKHGTDKIIYAVGQEYNMVEDAVICKKGFHFCTKPADCFNYYNFDSSNLVFEVEALGNISTKVDGDSKVATNHLKVIRQIEWSEMLQLCNEGKDNLGLRNSGNWNSGDWNSGNWNSGNWNSGNWNSGNKNTGNGNTGNWNSGYRNSGDWNSGDWNSGDMNNGNINSGNKNNGNRNSGEYNSGIANSGIANKGNRHTGAFCTGNANFTLFNKPTDMTYNEFIASKAYSLLYHVETNKWVKSSEMTDEQKQSRPHYEVQGGMYLDVPFRVAFSEKWQTWTPKERGEFTKLPNFDADIFFEITGVKI